MVTIESDVDREAILPVRIKSCPDRCRYCRSLISIGHDTDERELSTPT